MALLELCEPAQGHQVHITTRNLLTFAHISKAEFPAALKRIEEMGLVDVQHGDTRHASRYTCKFSGSISDPLNCGKNPSSGSISDPQRPLFPTHSGSISDPLPPPNKALTPNENPSGLSTASQLMIDQIFCAKAENFDPNDITTFRAWLHSYMCKLGRDERGQPTPHAPAPSKDLVAQFLACGEPRRLGAILDSLMCDRKDCHSYAWFVTVALQRIHGITFTETKQARAALRDVKRAQKQPAAQQTGLEFAEDIQQQLRQAAGGKSL